MSWASKLWPFRRRNPKLVLEFKGDASRKCVGMRLSAVDVGEAEDSELRAMAAVLLALEKGAFQLNRENGFDNSGMDKLWRNACELGCTLLVREGFVR